MLSLILIASGILVGLIVTLVWSRRGRMGTLLMWNDHEVGEKEKRKARVMGLFQFQDAVRNADVEKLLRVSDATATNYLSELEADGKIQQIGTYGPSVSYKKGNRLTRGLADYFGSVEPF